MSLIIEVENYSQCKNKKKKLKACFTPENASLNLRKKHLLITEIFVPIKIDQV